MVRIGHFTVNLVRADTKEVFKEHTGPDNNVYAEVEPGVDYFVRISSTRGELIVKTKVDGVQVHKMSGKPSIKSKYVGNWERTNGESKITALRFNNATQATKQEGGQTDDSSMLTGKVEVKFYEQGAQTRVKSNNDVAPKEFKSDVKVAGKKCVLSGTGSQVIKGRKKETRAMKHVKGKRLCTITLHYCTAMGLILNKILDAPPTSQPAPLVPAPLIDNDTKASAKPEKKVKPEKKRSASAAMLPPPDENGNKKVAAAIDLTGDSDDDENERWL